VKAGTVTMAGRRSGYGNVVVVDHGDGLTTLYAHCDSLSVRAGQQVQPGDVIAQVGDTGRATGPHLHFEVRSDGVAVDPIETFGWRR
jgi:murein DD-endopeptidase MepM/ murein hydrolase activator NlpD